MYILLEEHQYESRLVEKILKDMKQIEVVAAIIRKGDKIFATQRGYGEWKDWWEFPGGKMEAGETPEEALKREIREELSTEISVDEFLRTVEYDYPKFHLTMHCYLCSLLTEALHLNEHEAAKWLAKDELASVKWLPADLEIIKTIKEMRFIVIGITDNPNPWFPPEVLEIIRNGRVFSGGKRHHEIVAPLLP